MKGRLSWLLTLFLVLILSVLAAPALAWLPDDGQAANVSSGGTGPSASAVGPSAASRVFMPLIFGRPAPGGVTGVVRNATNAQPIPGATVCDGGTSTCVTANSNGQYTLANLTPGGHTLRASASGFITLEQSVTILAGQTISVDLILSPTLAQGEIRVVLTWGQTPQDLDSHLWLPPVHPYHVYWNNEGNCGADPFACLDVDDVTSYGPETITIVQRYPGAYVYGVYNYSQESGASLAASGAHVRVYGTAGLMRDFAVPSGAGVWWHVFDLDANGNIVVQNHISNTSPGPYNPDGGTMLRAQGLEKARGLSSGTNSTQR